MSRHTACLPEHRRPRLAERLRQGELVRAIECHSPLSALIGERARGTDGRGFDALWLSGFSHATALALPDTELGFLERRLDLVADVASATSLPLIVDMDTGGDASAFMLLCRRLEQLGVSAIMVEDKCGAKRTSLADGVSHRLEDPARFVAKIAAGRAALASPDTLILARTESLIAGAGLDEAMARARAYVQSPADGLVVHSKDRTGGDVLAFLERYAELQEELSTYKPLVLIPTAYNSFTGDDLAQRGASVVIHANHMIRAAYRAMQDAAGLILDHDRSLEADHVCAPVAHLIEAIGAS